MSAPVALPYQEHKNWRTAFLVLSVLIIVLMPFLSKDYGQTGDEWLQIQYGEHIWNYFFHGDKRALNYDDMSLQYLKQELYGGFFDFGTTILHHWLPAIPILVLRHFCNALFGALMMVFTGLLAHRLSRKWSVGVLALVFIFFSPRIFGESMNNPKDIPFAAGFIIGVYFALALIEDAPAKLWRNALGLMLGFGIAFGVRSAGGFLQIAYFVAIAALSYFFNTDFRNRLKTDKKLLKRIGLFGAGALLLGYIIGLAFWPYGLQSPVSNPLESLKGMTNRETNIRVLFEGRYTWAHSLPWYYEFKWIFLTNPISVLLGFLLYIVLVLKIRKEYGSMLPLFLLFGALFPICYMIYKHSTVYDSWRHVFFVYPFWVAAAAIGWDTVTGLIKAEAAKKIPVGIAIAMLLLLPAVVWSVRSHPNQTVYFNELQGGAKGAYGYYDLDYYQNSGKQAADWILKNVKHADGRKVVVRSNMSEFNAYFKQDSNWIGADYGRYQERHHTDWDYYVASPRYISAELMQNDKWAPSNTVHKIEIDGVPLCIVLKRTSTAGIAAYEAFEKKDYATAAQWYSEYIKTDNSDEGAIVNYAISLASVGQVDVALAQMARAITLDPGNAQYFQLQAQLYQAKGDMQHAQQSMAHAQELAAAEQGEQE